MLTDSDLDRLLALEAAATAGPWVQGWELDSEEPQRWPNVNRKTGDLRKIVAYESDDVRYLNDCRLIAESRNAIADLVLEVKAARATLAAVRAFAERNNDPLNVTVAYIAARQVLALLDGKGGG